MQNIIKYTIFQHDFLPSVIAYLALIYEDSVNFKKHTNLY